MASVGSAARGAASISERQARRERMHTRINRATGYLNILGLGWVVPILKIAAGDDVRSQLGALWMALGVPVFAIIVFLVAWAELAPTVKTSLGAIPGPTQVWDQAVNLYNDHKAERAKEGAFYERQEKRNARYRAQGKEDRIKWRQYTGNPTYFDQIVTSLYTVFFGFLIASLIAVPLGILCGLSPIFSNALNPLIQIFKPVSPLAWLPLVTMVVSAVYVTEDPMFSKSFLTSAFVVTLCSLWPTLINTGVSTDPIGPG